MFGRIVKFCEGLTSSGKPEAKVSPTRSWLNLEELETRETPSTTSAITSNLHGLAAPGGKDIWFNSVAKVSGLSTTTITTIHVTDQTISFTTKVGRTVVPYTVSVPDATVTFDPRLKYATDSFVNGEWVVSSPTKYLGNVFLSGAVLEVPRHSGLLGSIKNVTWQGTFSSDTAGISLDWKWTAAAYKKFSSDLSTIGVKPSDAPTPRYHNFDRAGTPEAFKSFVVGRGHGWGYHKSYSSHETVVPTPSTSVPATLSGSVFLNGVGLGGVSVTLSGTDTSGHSVSFTTTTSDDGLYSFSGIPVGSYTVSADVSGYSDFAAYESIGTVDGLPEGTDVVIGDGLIGGIALGSGAVGTDYNFSLYPPSTGD